MIIKLKLITNYHYAYLCNYMFILCFLYINIYVVIFCCYSDPHHPPACPTTPKTSTPSPQDRGTPRGLTVSPTPTPTVLGTTTVKLVSTFPIYIHIHIYIYIYILHRTYIYIYIYNHTETLNKL